MKVFDGISQHVSLAITLARPYLLVYRHILLELAMINLRKSHDRGHANHGWLDSYHTFSFGDYYDPQEMGFGALRVINEDRVAPQGGFPTHPHRDMEIVTYILEGALGHKDSMGNGSVIRVGDVQRMTAGTGITHSEANASASEPVHLLQIWIQPDTKGLVPSYEQTHFPLAEKQNRFRLIASRDGREGSVTIHQDTAVYAAVLNANQALSYTLAAPRRGYLHLARGRVTLNGYPLEAGDGAKINGPEILALSASETAEILLFDLA
jgi:redox-sensitive bicupin YhaK (pirin superfamily)